MAKLFITGATGYIGSAIAELFQKNDYEVVALVRSEDSAEKVKKLGYTPVQGDVTKPDTYKRLLNEADIVIHAAATLDADFPKVDTAVVENVIEALKGTNKTFIYTSGVWVLGNTGNNIANDETKANPIPLVAWRVAVEQRVIEAGQKDIRTIVVRPGVIYGRGGGIIRGFLEAAKREGEVQYPGEGNNHWSSVHIDDLANLYLLAAQKANPGSLYNATHGAPITVRTIAEHVAKVANAPGKIKSIAIEEAKKLFGAYAEGLVLDQKIESPRAKRELGWEPKGTTLLDDVVVTQKTLAASAN